MLFRSGFGGRRRPSVDRLGRDRPQGRAHPRVRPLRFEALEPRRLLALVMVDVSNPAGPVRLGAYDTAGTARSVDVIGSIAYVADGTGGLQIIDVTDPAAPVRLGAYHTPGDAAGLQVAGNRVYVADSSAGLMIFDVSNPATPALLAACSAASGGRGVQVVGGLAYVSVGTAGLRLVDVGNPLAPVYLGGCDTPGTASASQTVGGLVYVADLTGGLRVLQAGSPVASVSQTAGSTYRLNLAQTIALGTDYALLIGPEITSAAGVAMDQDNDGVVREPSDDVYFARLRVNLAPAVDLNGAAPGGDYAATFTESGGPVSIVSPAATLADADSARLASITVRITDLQDLTAEVITADTTGTSITSSYDSFTGVLVLSGSETTAAYRQVLRTVRYHNTSQEPSGATRTVTFVASGSGLLGKTTT